jgi:hypothetical protein
MSEPLLTVEDVAKLLSMSAAYIREHSGPDACRPVIPCVMLGNRRRFRKDDLERFIADCMAEHRRRYT